VIHLTCCAGTDAERFNRTSDHTRVHCTACGTSFCLDARDVKAEAEHRPTQYERTQGKARRWYCSQKCQNVGRRELGVNPSDAALASRIANAAKARAARVSAVPETESRETLF
jgi:hypothetical protein